MSWIEIDAPRRQSVTYFPECHPPLRSLSEAAMDTSWLDFTAVEMESIRKELQAEEDAK